MAGHSKWSNIRHKKKIKDKRKSKLFSKLTNNINNSIKHGGNNLKHNTKLKNAISKALQNNVSKSVIENIVNKSNKKIHIYETYASYFSSGCILVFECEKDNKNKILYKLKEILNKYCISIISLKSIDHIFNKLGKISFLDNYNEKFITHILKKYKTFISSKNYITIKYKNIYIINNILKNLNLKTYCFTHMEAKKKIQLTNKEKKKVNLLLNELKKNIYIRKIFTNLHVN